MSPAPESPRRPSDLSIPPHTNSSLSITTILSRASRTPHDGPVGPFTADRRASSSFRRNFSGGPRPAPFQWQNMTSNEPGNLPSAEPGSDSMNTRARLQSALEAQRRRMEERRTDDWRAQSSLPRISRSAISGQRRQRLESSSQPDLATPISGPTTPEVRPATPSRLYISSPRLFISNDSSESESDTDDDTENKFPSSSITTFPRPPPPTVLTLQSSPRSQSLTSSLKRGDEDPSRNAYILSCRFCANLLTSRGMRARLVADARVHIWSTDHQPKYCSELPIKLIAVSN